MFLYIIFNLYFSVIAILLLLLLYITLYSDEYERFFLLKKIFYLPAHYYQAISFFNSLIYIAAYFWIFYYTCRAFLSSLSCIFNKNLLRFMSVSY